jgi:hypothetical protein
VLRELLGLSRYGPAELVPDLQAVGVQVARAELDRAMRADLALSAPATRGAGLVYLYVRLTGDRPSTGDRALLDVLSASERRSYLPRTS